MNYCGNCFKEYPESGPCPHCGHIPAEDVRRFPQALRAGSVLDGRYIVGRPLGQGGFGITYKAMDYDTQQLVAIKEFMPSSIVFRDSSQRINAHSELMLEDFNRAKADFLSEAKTLSQFNGLDNICDIYSYFEENGTAYFAMEYADGMPLDSYVKKQGKPLSFEQARDILLPVMEALGHVHEKGIVHRDISPDNIILRPDGRAMLIDFGAARYSAGEKTKSLTVVLKHGFAPKEQYTRRGKQGPFTDVYALAATMYWLICGKVPPEAIDRFTNDELVAPSKLGIKIPPKAERALLKALAVEDSQRYKSMKDFAAALRPDAVKQKTKTKTKTKSRRGILIAAVCALALVCVAVFGLKSFKSAPAEPLPTPVPATAAPIAPYIADIPAPSNMSNAALAEYYGSAVFTDVPGGKISDAGTVVYGSGYGAFSDVLVAVCFDNNGRIIGLIVDASGEVPDIGQKCAAREYTDLYIGATSGGDVDVLSGASFTSWAIQDAVDYALENLSLINPNIASYSAPAASNSDAWQLRDNGTLYLLEPMDDFSKAEDAPWHDRRSEITSIVVTESVTEIPSYALRGCTSLKYAIIPDSVTRIGDYAFAGCSALDYLSIADSVTEIGDSAFRSCSSLRTVELPAALGEIKTNTFNSCISLESVTIPVSVTEIASAAFGACSKLKDVHYTGTQEQWNQVNVTTTPWQDNMIYTDATFHFLN